MYTSTHDTHNELYLSSILYNFYDQFIICTSNTVA